MSTELSTEADARKFPSGDQHRSNTSFSWRLQEGGSEGEGEADAGSSYMCCLLVDWRIHDSLHVEGELTA